MKSNVKITGYGYNNSFGSKRTFFGKDNDGFLCRGSLQLESAISNVIKPHIPNKKEFLLIQNLTKNWEQIVGKKYYKFCYPKSVTFGREKSDGIKMTIAAYNSSIGFFLENNQDLILERIAMLYGYKSISKIIIKQEPRQINIDQNIEIKLSSEQESNLKKRISMVEDKGLAETLFELGKLTLKLR